jgi:GntR family transcriptional repressor for pyruvate dehydrogenase complex
MTMKAIEQTERYTLSQLVVQNLKQYILEQEMMQGDRLPAERELSRIMNVSRAILREALRSLESSGIVEIRHGEGTFVSNRYMNPMLESLSFAMRMKGTSSREITEIRYLLEAAALDAAVEHADPHMFDELEQLTKTAADRGRSDEERMVAHAALHLAIIRCTGNESFIRLAELFVMQTPEIANRSDSHQFEEEHRRYIDALRRKDVITAKQILKSQLLR